MANTPMSSNPRPIPAKDRYQPGQDIASCMVIAHNFPGHDVILACGKCDRAFTESFEDVKKAKASGTVLRCYDCESRGEREARQERVRRAKHARDSRLKAKLEGVKVDRTKRKGDLPFANSKKEPTGKSALILRDLIDFPDESWGSIAKRIGVTATTVEKVYLRYVCYPRMIELEKQLAEYSDMLYETERKMRTEEAMK